MKLSKRINGVIIAASIAVSGYSLFSPSAALAGTCAQHKDITRQLALKFKEKRRAFGLIGTGRMMEVFVSQTGSWTMVITSANKISCVVAAGSSWEQWKVKFGPTT